MSGQSDALTQLDRGQFLARPLLDDWKRQHFVIWTNARHYSDASSPPFSYEDLLKRDKVNLDIFWLKDESLEDSANLPDPDIIAAEVVEDLQGALAQFETIVSDLNK